MEQNYKLDENIDEPPVIEEIILPERSLTLEKIKTNRNKNEDSKSKHRRKRHHSDDSSQDDASDADDTDSGHKDENENDDDGSGDDDGKSKSNKSEEDGKPVVVEVLDDALEVKPDRPANAFTASKNIAQGMMDIALITANANQLRYILAYNRGSSTYYINLFLVSTSLLLQIVVGLCFVLKGKYKKQTHPQTVKKLNSIIMIGVFLVTIINVFIASFTDTSENSKSTN